MDNQFVMISEIKAETQIFKFINLKTLFITIGFLVFGYVTSGMVHEMLSFVYIVFNGVVGFVLSMKSPFNKGKLIYQSIFLYIRNRFHKKDVYHALADCEYNSEDKILESKLMYNDKFLNIKKRRE